MGKHTTIAALALMLGSCASPKQEVPLDFFSTQSICKWGVEGENQFLDELCQDEGYVVGTTYFPRGQSPAKNQSQNNDVNADGVLIRVYNCKGDLGIDAYWRTK